MRLFCTYIFICISITTHGQDCSEKSIKAAKRQFKKNSNYIKKANIAFNIALCYRTQNDSVYRYWLWQTIENNKQGGCTKQISQIINTLYSTGFAYYELKDYKGAETYLSKAIRANQQSNPPLLDSTVYLYYGISLFNNKHYTDAIDALRAYKKSQPADTLADLILKDALIQNQQTKP